MVVFSHTPIKESLLSFLSSAALTALSNKLTEKASTINSKVTAIESKIKLLKNKNNLSTENKLSVGPLLLEAQLLDIAKDQGLSVDEIYENPPVGDIDVDELYTTINDQLPPNAARTKGLLASTELSTLQTEKSTLTATLFLVLDDIDKIASLLSDRANGIVEEPKINYSAFEDLATIDDRDLENIVEHQNFIAKKIVVPLQENKAAVNAYKAQLAIKNKTEEDDAIQINLLGPPISTDGKFILTDKGLYYDSRNGGLPDIMIRDALIDTWKLNFAPNTGGHGIEYSDFDLLEYSNTIFSPDYKVTNDTVDRLYKIDSILESIQKNKAKHISIVSGHISDLIVSGYAVSSAMVQNYHRSIASISYSYDAQVTKRKKQLQIAGLFGSFIVTDKDFPLGPDSILEKASPYFASTFFKTYTASTQWQVTPDYRYAYIALNGESVVYRLIKHIPINDFSFLKGTGITPTVDTQKKSVLQSGDVKDVVLPLKPKFVKGNSQSTLYVSDFAIPIQGIGTLVHVSGNTNVSSVQPFVKSLTDDIHTQNLVVMYNFLNANIESPSSGSYNLPNEAYTSPSLNGKLVSPTLSQIYPSGLGMAYLGGTLYDAVQSESPEPWYGDIPKGSYVRLPNNFKNGELNRGSVILDDLTYNLNGFAIDCWVFVPTLLSNMTFNHRYRTILANENTGPGHAPNSTNQITASKVIDEFASLKQQDLNKVHGMIVGFNIDPDKESGNLNGSHLRFGIYPTVSQNRTDGEWGPSVCLAEKVVGNDPINATKTRLGMEILASQTTQTGRSFVDCSGQFVHFAVSFDYKKDQIKVYLDKELLATSSISVCFNTNPGQPLNIPSPAYANNNTNEVNLWSWGVNLKQGEGVLPYAKNFYESLHEGLDEAPSISLLTPWIIGGGFTDSIPRNYTAEQVVGPTTPLGFLGSNTNDSYWQRSQEAGIGGIIGQHSPGIGGWDYAGVSRDIPRSGLDGFIGSFKFYNAPLNITEVEKNYKAQQAFFKNIRT